MASQTSGRNTGDQDAPRATPNHSERRSAPSATSPPHTQTLRDVWVRGQLVDQQLAAFQKEKCDTEVFLWSAIDAFVKKCGTVERKCMEYYRAYKAAAEERGSLINDIHDLSTKHLALQHEIEKADDLTEAANRRAEELDALSTDLAEKNVSMQQGLDQAHERIRVLENRTMELEASSGELAGQNLAFQQDLGRAHGRIHLLESRGVGLDPPSAGASVSKDRVIHELDTVDPRSPEMRITELQAKLMALEGEYDNVVERYKLDLANAFERIRAAESKLEQFGDNRETDSIVSCVSNRESPSPDDRGSQKATESKTNAERRGRKQPKKERGRPRKLAPAKPDLRIVCN